MAELNFLDVDGQAIIDEMIADYESMTGRVVHPGQIERLLIDAFAYRELLLRSQINDAARQNLLEFSRAPFIDYLGEIVGVRRLTSSAAVCSIQLQLVEGHGPIVIPQGMRVQSIDGVAVFALDEDTPVDASTNTVTVSATCLTTGAVGNGYAVGNVNIILDPQPYLLSASNTNVTAGGADTESDDQLRERIRLAPGTFSVAGPVDAYKFWAKSANQNIVDVSVTSPTPGQVNIYPLLADGELPNSEILDQVYSACNAEKVRPLTDTVVVEAPTVVEYDLKVTLTLLTGTVAADAKKVVENALEAFTKDRRQRMGMDIVREKIIQICMVDGVYEVGVEDPASTLVIEPHEVAICRSIEVVIGGYKDE